MPKSANFLKGTTSRMALLAILHWISVIASAERRKINLISKLKVFPSDFSGRSYHHLRAFQNEAPMDADSYRKDYRQGKIDCLRSSLNLWQYESTAYFD